MASPVTKAAAIAAAEAQAAKQGTTDPEHLRRLRTQFIDQWESRWSQPLPGGKNYA